jgi:hypothetical protein
MTGLADVINLKCFNQIADRISEENIFYKENRVVRFSLGESSKLAKMSGKGYSLIEFDLDITPTHYNIGQYKSELKEDLIVVFSIDRTTLKMEQDSFSQPNTSKDKRVCILEE